MSDEQDYHFDESASVDRFARLHYPQALAYIAALHYSPADTDRVVVAVLADAIRRADERKPGEDWGAFVTALAAQRIRRELASQGPTPLSHYYRHLTKRVTDDQATAAYFRQLREAFARCAKKVNRTELDTLKTRYGRGLGVDAVAEQTGRPIAAVRRGLRRVRLRLAECMHGRPIDDVEAAATEAQELTLRYLDGDLAPRELDQMQWAIARDDDERRKHIALLELETLLCTMRKNATADAAEQVVQSLSAEASQTSEEGVLAGPETVDPALAEIAEAAGPVDQARRKRRRRRRAQAVLQLTLLTVLVGGLAAATWIYRDRLTITNDPSVSSAVVVDRQGRITYERGDTVRLLRNSTVLQPGDVVHVPETSHVRLAFDKASRFTVAPASSVRIERGAADAENAPPPRRLVLISGTVDAELDPLGREAPVQVYTPQADLRSDKARFSVTLEDGRTRVTVAGGQLRVRRRADDQRVELAEGQGLFIAPSRPMTPVLAENLDSPASSPDHAETHHDDPNGASDAANPDDEADHATRRTGIFEEPSDARAADGGRHALAPREQPDQTRQDNAKPGGIHAKPTPAPPAAPAP